jgi:hypothetical protein
MKNMVAAKKCYILTARCSATSRGEFCCLTEEEWAAVCRHIKAVEEINMR